MIFMIILFEIGSIVDQRCVRLFFKPMRSIECYQKKDALSKKEKRKENNFEGKINYCIS